MMNWSIRWYILVQFLVYKNIMNKKFTHNDEISAIGKSLLKDGVLYKNQDMSHTIFEILT